MAVAKHRSSANPRPIHMDEPAMGAPYKGCPCSVSPRNAPGAISAIALIVRPVRPSVGFIVVGFSDGELADAIVLFFIFYCSSLLRVLIPGRRFCLAPPAQYRQRSRLETICNCVSKARAINKALAERVPSVLPHSVQHAAPQSLTN